MNPITLLRMRNRISGALFPQATARPFIRRFLSPRRLPAKDWENAVERSAERITFGPQQQLSALRWHPRADYGRAQRILLVHGWESRATHMMTLADTLARQGFDVFALDAPLHGQSGGERSNPVEFARAICEADTAFGPFAGAVGHSMGGAALAIARGMGAAAERYVLLAAPASLLEVLQGFAQFIGLPDKAAKAFISGVETEVGVPAAELNTGRLLATDHRPTLLIHADNDAEIPVSAMQRIRKFLPQAQIWTPAALGHRRILRDPLVAEQVRAFMQEGALLNVSG